MRKLNRFPRPWIVTLAWLVFTVWSPGPDISGSAPIGLEQAAASLSKSTARQSAAEFDRGVSMSYQGRWRYTRYGWQDLNEWIPPESVQPTGLELIHPGLLAIGVVLGALGVLLWCSEEWDTARLLEGTDSVCRRRRPRSPSIHDFLPESV